MINITMEDIRAHDGLFSHLSSCNLKFLLGGSTGLKAAEETKPLVSVPNKFPWNIWPLPTHSMQRPWGYDGRPWTNNDMDIYIDPLPDTASKADMINYMESCTPAGYELAKVTFHTTVALDTTDRNYEQFHEKIQCVGTLVAKDKKPAQLIAVKGEEPLLEKVQKIADVGAFVDFDCKYKYGAISAIVEGLSNVRTCTPRIIYPPNDTFINVCAARAAKYRERGYHVAGPY